MTLFLQTKFGEQQSTESEDFFSTISQFLVQFRKISMEKLPHPSVPRCVCISFIDVLLTRMYMYNVCFLYSPHTPRTGTPPHVRGQRETPTSSPDLVCIYLNGHIMQDFV